MLLASNDTMTTFSLFLLPVYRPLALELTAVNESVVMDNVEVFKKNGFEFLIDEDGGWFENWS